MPDKRGTDNRGSTVYLTPKAFIYFFLVKMLLPLPKLRFLYARTQIVFQICGFQLSILYFY